MVSRRTSRWGEVLLYVVPLLGLWGVTMWGLWRMPNQLVGMYANNDGMWAAWVTRGVFQWGNAFDVAPFNPLTGMGSIFPALLPWLNPGALSLGMPLPKSLAYVLSYTIYFVELSASHVILYRVLGQSPLRSVTGAVVYILVLFPPWSQMSGALSWYSLAPMYAHLGALCNGILALLVVAGRYRTPGNVAGVMGIAVLTFSGFMSASVTFATYLPAYATAGVALLWAQRPERSAWFWKCGAVLVSAVVLILYGFPGYLTAVGEMSARAANYPHAFAAGLRLLSIGYWREVWQQFSVCSRPDVLLCNQVPVFWFLVAALAGAAVQLFRSQWPSRSLAVWLLCYVAFVHVYEFTSEVSLFGSVMHIVSTPFLIWPAYSFFPLFVVALVFGATDAIARGALFWRRSSAGAEARQWWTVKTIGCATATVVVSTLIWHFQIGPNQPPPPPTNQSVAWLGRSSLREPVVGPITQYLIDHASLKPGEPFRGYTATYLGDPAGHMRNAVGYTGSNRSVVAYINSRAYLDEHYRNRFQEMDLWEFDVPTFEEYGQWITQQVDTWTADLFSSPGDNRGRSFLHLYKLDLNVLRAAGVRFLITDLAIDDPRLTRRARQEAPGAGAIELYEMAHANVGTYSPTRTVKVATFAEATAGLRILSQSDSLADEVVVFDDVRGPLVPAGAATLQIDRGGFQVSAESSGRSVLLVPVQFSRCFTLDPAPVARVNPTPIRLLRGNGIQTLVEFSGRLDATIRFRFGLPGNTACRLQDAREFQALDTRR